MDLESCYPADVAKRAAICWRHTRLVICPSCHGPALVGWLDREPVAYACHRCGPITRQDVHLDCGAGKSPAHPHSAP